MEYLGLGTIGMCAFVLALVAVFVIVVAVAVVIVVAVAVDVIDCYLKSLHPSLKKHGTDGRTDRRI